jgi:hypothetical protein
MHSEEFESVVLSLISIEDYEVFRKVGNSLAEFQRQLKAMNNEEKVKALKEETLMNMEAYCKLSSMTTLFLLYKMVKYDSNLIVEILEDMGVSFGDEITLKNTKK